ncbi:hypothetical protein GCM10007160_19340 [Litchfieldella qijiaojingensis]|uniref:Lysozyme family protein n=1 Tax=Litchfieldella qijiaojingensis TaxID=980347 RepID=A0ABQ2YR00_9GAMM|nr:hypothetical protein [Halomonas qijiaojingensis]GGX91938.1 hypothetical protein GCM10007160_19340 [Halomonas qijiaojingensis]
MSVTLTQALRREYEELFESCLIRSEHQASVERVVDHLCEQRSRYQSVGEQQGIPWGFVAVVHNMESSGDFSRHLHNGDTLERRTVHVPKGRPKQGSPPFTWEESAGDALSLKRLGAEIDWSLAGTLYQLERYNGWGYRLFHPHVLSPYLWSFSNHYQRGKYVADGTWSDTAVSKQCGGAVLLRRLAEKGEIDFQDRPSPRTKRKPLICSYSMSRSRSAAVVASVEALQRWLNTFPGLFVKVDGIPGERTSEAYRKVTGNYLPGDPRT